jgi:Flp pilus assembly protein TadG
VLIREPGPGGVPPALSNNAHAHKFRRSGASTVEFALVGPLLFFLILGIFEFGRAFMVMELLTDAARHGCRQAIIEGSSTQQITDAATSYLTSQGMSGEGVQVTINDGAGNVTEAQNVPAYTELTVTVTIAASTTTWLPTGMQMYLPGIGNVPVSIPSTLQGQFTMRRE